METITKWQDSIEVGTPAKGGALKVYFDSANEEEARVRISNAKNMLDYAKSLISEVK